MPREGPAARLRRSSSAEYPRCRAPAHARARRGTGRGLRHRTRTLCAGAVGDEAGDSTTGVVCVCVLRKNRWRSRPNGRRLWGRRIESGLQGHRTRIEGTRRYTPAHYIRTPYIPAPYTPAPYTPAPYTPAPYTPAPYTPAPYTPAPYTPAPYTPAPYTPAPYTPAPYTPAPYTPAPYTPAPYTPAPYTTAPYTPAPYTLHRRRTQGSQHTSTESAQHTNGRHKLISPTGGGWRSKPDLTNTNQSRHWNLTDHLTRGAMMSRVAMPSTTLTPCRTPRVLSCSPFVKSFAVLLSRHKP